MPRRRRARVGVIERRNPIPPGRYWVRFPATPGRLESWRKWTATLKGRGRVVHVEEGEGGVFAIFELVEPVARWPAEWKLSAPNVATPDVEQASDTVQRPAPEVQPSSWEAIALPFQGLGLILGLWLLYEITKE